MGEVTRGQLEGSTSLGFCVTLPHTMAPAVSTHTGITIALLWVLLRPVSRCTPPAGAGGCSHDSSLHGMASSYRAAFPYHSICLPRRHTQAFATYLLRSQMLNDNPPDFQLHNSAVGSALVTMAIITQYLLFLEHLICPSFMLMVHSELAAVLLSR